MRDHLYQEEEGSVIYFVMDFDVDFMSPMGLDQPTVDAMKVVLEYVRGENEGCKPLLRRGYATKRRV